MKGRRNSLLVPPGPLSDKNRLLAKKWGLSHREFREALNAPPVPPRTPEEIAAALRRAELQVDSMREEIESRRAALKAAAAEERDRRLREEIEAAENNKKVDDVSNT